MGSDNIDNDVFGGGIYMGSVVKSSVDAPEANGAAVGMGTGSARFEGGMLTYKRRKIDKTAKVMEDEMIQNGAGTNIEEKSMKNSSDEADKKRPYYHPIPSSDCSLKKQRDVVLKQIFQSIEIECSLKKRIEDALSFHPGSSSRTIGKESVHSCEAGSKVHIQNGSVHNDLGNATKCSVDIASGASAYDTNHETISELCQGTIFEIIMSEKFAKLCSLLLGNEMKVEKFFDLSHINSRMKEKAYESSPLQFHSDMQQIWSKIQKVGADMIALARCLSEKTLSSFRGQLVSCANTHFEDVGNEFLFRDSDVHNTELTDASGLVEVHTCRRCGENSDGRNGLVCDSCEEMYHISCIEPSVKEIPTRNWYCTDCTANGIGSPHDDCIACERLNASTLLFDGNHENELLYGDAPVELEDSSKALVAYDEDERFQHCNICHTLVSNDEDYRICGHAFCPHKFYHEKCLTSKQLLSHGTCWYCPSCLCRACLVDRDDDKIVMCDGCDHAYHLYCMHPPQTSIPKGKWFCKKCDSAIQRIQKAKRSFEIMQNRYKQRGLDGKVKTDEALNKSGGVDMLLNAAKTLNYEENLAAMGLKTK